MRLAALLLLAVLALTSCGNGSGGDGTTGEGDGPQAAGPDRQENPGKPAAAPEERAKRESPPLASSQRAIVYTAKLTVRTGDIRARARQAQRMVSGTGGHVQDQEITSSDEGGETRATVTFKVPVEQYRRVLGRLGSQLGTLVSKEQHARDVTQQVADVEARVRSAEAALKRLRSLLERAGSVDDLLRVQQEIADQQAELESLQARQRALENRTSYATVTLRLREPTERDEPSVTGFWSGLLAGWHALLALGSWLLTALGVILPFLVPLAAVACLAWWLRRRRRNQARTAG